MLTPYQKRMRMKKIKKSWVVRPGKKKAPPIPGGPTTGYKPPKKKKFSPVTGRTYTANLKPKSKKPKVVKTSKKVAPADEKKYVQQKKLYKLVEQGLIDKFFPKKPVRLDEDGDPLYDDDDYDENGDPAKGPTAKNLPNFIYVKLQAVWNQLETLGEFDRNSMIEMNRLHQISL